MVGADNIDDGGVSVGCYKGAGAANAVLTVVFVVVCHWLCLFWAMAAWRP
jgi:hypothetical protein